MDEMEIARTVRNTPGWSPAIPGAPPSAFRFSGFWMAIWESDRVATSKETVDFILGKLRHEDRFAAKAMFGEYALYGDGKVVALICDDRLYVKIAPATAGLAECEQGPPYPGAKAHYIVEEGMLTRMVELPEILLRLAGGLPAKKTK